MLKLCCMRGPCALASHIALEETGADRRISLARRRGNSRHGAATAPAAPSRSAAYGVVAATVAAVAPKSILRVNTLVRFLPSAIPKTGKTAVPARTRPI